MNPLPSRGRPGVTMVMSIERQLTHEDLYRLATQPKKLVAPPTIQRLRTSHHQMARALASGKSIREVAHMVGRTPQRIGDLTRDPAFANLVLYYEDQFKELVIDREQHQQEIYADITEMASIEIQERLESPTEIKKIPISELRQIAKDLGDRSTAPPKQVVPMQRTPEIITFSMGERDIRPVEIIDLEPEEEKPRDNKD